MGRINVYKRYMLILGRNNEIRAYIQAITQRRLRKPYVWKNVEAFCEEIDLRKKDAAVEKYVRGNGMKQPNRF